MAIKPLSFKGDSKKAKKRKHRSDETEQDGHHHHQTSTSNRETKTNTNNPSGSTDPSSDDSWTTPDIPSDVAGPTVLILADTTNPTMCLASDAHGNVFASPMENIFESHVETAEPHDVRQVWVASAVAGTADGQISLKASHGGYLSCDGIGVLGARREARGVQEGFVLERVPVGEDGDGDGDGDGKAVVAQSSSPSSSSATRYRLRTAAGTSTGKGRRYLAATVTTTITTTKTKTKTEDQTTVPHVKKSEFDDDDEEEDDSHKSRQRKINISLRGDGEAGDPGTELVVKMQARFKPRLQMNKATKEREKVSRRELEQAAGRKLTDDEVRRLKRAKRDGSYYENILDLRAKSKHDKFAS
ncbi:hypothetical protein PV10_00404 [Exophiala mesophila]|uniref:Uncharacterized protein n=1 Tax=Exophiala mesophila TaxID=212818 RepID=A0A0D1ZRK1_EXOME|nr:uncharacterized protein PV10_00404 [Exophiala mesophila]KIV96554.1 hypothetical protein PV10_00404 [Exophiala mesophila]